MLVVPRMALMLKLTGVLYITLEVGDVGVEDWVRKTCRKAERKTETE